MFMSLPNLTSVVPKSIEDKSRFKLNVPLESPASFEGAYVMPLISFSK